jgi:hypothetical protein
MSDDKQNNDEKVPPPPSGGLHEESSVIALLESLSAKASAELPAAAAVVGSDNVDSKQPAAAETLANKKPAAAKKSASTISTTNTDEAQESHKSSLAKSEKEGGGVAPASLERSAAVATTSQPGAFPIDGMASAPSPYRSFTAPEASSPPPPSPAVPQTVNRRERAEVLVSAELVQPEETHEADVEVGRGTVVEAKPIEEKEDQPIRLIDLWKNRSVRIIAVVIFFIIVGLIVGLVVGLKQSTRPIEIDNDDEFKNPPPRNSDQDDERD